MDTFAGKFAVVTGGGSGMGRELVIQLAAEGCAVAACDVRQDTAEETAALARAGAPDGTTVTAHACDVADEAQVARFRDEALAAHGADHVDLVFSNAGLGGGGSFINDPRGDVGAGVRGRLLGRVPLRPRLPAAAHAAAPRASWSTRAASTVSGRRSARACRTPRTPPPSSR